MAITLAQAGGIGVIHKNLEHDEQAGEVRKVKRFESGMVVNPITIHPEQTLADALALMKSQSISGIPVIARRTGRLVGIITNRDVRFAIDPAQPIKELMTRKLITVGEGVDMDEAKRLLEETSGLQLPNDLLLYAKTLSYLFALGQRLEPEVDLMKQSIPHLLKWLANAPRKQ